MTRSGWLREPRRLPKLLLSYGGVFLAYAGLVVAMTHPLITVIDTDLIGGSTDSVIDFWSEWAARQGPGTDLPVPPTYLLGYPGGAAMPQPLVSWADVGLQLALETIAGPVGAYNVVQMLHIALCGVTMYALGRRVVGSSWAAFLAGMVYAFWPFRLLDSSSAGFVAAEGLPLLLIVLHGLLEQPVRVRTGVASGLILAVIGYAEWRMLPIACITAVCYALYVLLRLSHSERHDVSIALLVFGATAALLLIPALWSLCGSSVSGDTAALLGLQEVPQSTDLLAFLRPHQQHPLLVALRQDAPLSDQGESVVAYLGYVTLALVVASLSSESSLVSSRPIWLSLALLSLVLALGPSLRFNDADSGVPLPYMLVEPLTAGSRLIEPRAFNAMLALPVAVLAASGTVGITSWLNRKGPGHWYARPQVTATIVGLLILVDYLALPYPAADFAVPDYYRALPAHPEDCALVELPAYAGLASNYLVYQTVHELPLVNGGQSPATAGGAGARNVAQLIARMDETGGIDTSLAHVSLQMSLLADAGVCYVIVHKDWSTAEQLADWDSYLHYYEIYEDDTLLAYSTQATSVVSATSQGELAAGIVLLDAELGRDVVYPRSELVLHLAWGTLATPASDVQLEVRLETVAGRSVQTETMSLVPDWPTSEWPADAVVRGEHRLVVAEGLDEGRYEIRLTLVDGQPGSSSVSSATVGEVALVVPEWPNALLGVSPESQPLFGDVLLLRAHGIEIAGTGLLVGVDWEALEDLDQNYKFFVHVYGTEIEPPVAQADVMPLDWTYPTAWWVPGERISDAVYVSLAGLPPGPYQAALGVYHPGTGERLPITNLGSQSEEVDRLLLGVVIVQ